ncbi:hypothetical protein EJ110_NYTH53216 [Nymphaea thermarum]|nr:hypothetical protein EJ110_NYTH53216 [Nymphaea thermarum]
MDNVFPAAIAHRCDGDLRPADCLPTVDMGTFSSRARTPRSTFPSKSSKLAPPAVDMWLILSATPTFSTAATESPPPMIVVTPFPLRSASFLAIA